MATIKTDATVANLNRALEAAGVADTYRDTVIKAVKSVQSASASLARTALKVAHDGHREVFDAMFIAAGYSKSSVRVFHKCAMDILEWVGLEAATAQLVNKAGKEISIRGLHAKLAKDHAPKNDAGKDSEDTEDTDEDESNGSKRERTAEAMLVDAMADIERVRAMIASGGAKVSPETLSAFAKLAGELLDAGKPKRKGSGPKVNRGTTGTSASAGTRAMSRAADATI